MIRAISARHSLSGRRPQGAAEGTSAFVLYQSEEVLHLDWETELRILSGCSYFLPPERQCDDDSRNCELQKCDAGIIIIG